MLTGIAGAVTGVAGAVLVVAGIAMLVLPGPGLLAIIAGLALLARRYAWASRLLERVRGRMPARLRWSRRPQPAPSRPELARRNADDDTPLTAA